MPSPVNGWRLKMGQIAFTAGQTVAAVAHGLPAAPTFIIASATDVNSVLAAANATTLSLSKTAGAATVSYLIAVE